MPDHQSARLARLIRLYEEEDGQVRALVGSNATEMELRERLGAWSGRVESILHRSDPLRLSHGCGFLISFAAGTITLEKARETLSNL
jgi:hypothetical protein